MDENLYPVLHSQVAMTQADSQAVIVLADSGRVTVLNELGTRIWQSCDGEHSVGQIVQIIVNEYEVDYPTAERDVIEFLDQMVEMQALMMQGEPGIRKVDGS